MTITTGTAQKPVQIKKSAMTGFIAMMLLGLGGFFALMFQGSSNRAWQAFLMNFLLFSGLAQGGVLFSVVMHLTKARWSRGITPLAESFAAFFPVSLVLYLLLFPGREDVFPWLHQELHGKAAWLNLPFLFSRDITGLVILYGAGILFVYYAKKSRRLTEAEDINGVKEKMSFLGVIYAIAFALVGSLLSYDLVMSAAPHFISTLFGAYAFIKAFYLGLAGLIILAAVLHLSPVSAVNVASGQFHDLGKLLFGFCLVWADFFYCQLVVIWYGNISEETHYLILRTVSQPWRGLAWFVFAVCFILPFIILLNRAVKTRPKIMIGICMAIIMGLWLEHLLLLGPELFPHAVQLPIGFCDGLIFIGFIGLMAAVITGYMSFFPDAVYQSRKEAV